MDEIGDGSVELVPLAEGWGGWGGGVGVSGPVGGYAVSTASISEALGGERIAGRGGRGEDERMRRWGAAGGKTGKREKRGKRKGGVDVVEELWEKNKRRQESYYAGWKCFWRKTG